jgi:hypothetical protein
MANFQAAEQDYEKEKLNERIAKLAGGVAVIQVLTRTYFFACCFFFSVRKKGDVVTISHGFLLDRWEHKQKPNLKRKS